MENSIKSNVLFLIIDSFRADKFYGKEKTSVTPNLDSLIEKGACFTQAIGSAPVTVPAISCILTGRYPFSAIISGGYRYKLNSNIPNFVSRLKTSGYYTVAVAPKIVSLSGLTNDFEHVIEYPGHNGLYDGVGKTVLTVFEEKKLKNPWFFYIHLVDIHGTSRGFPENFNDEKYGMNQYERMVSAMDEWFGKIFQKINFKNTLVVLTADHGNDAGIYTPEMELDKNYVNHGHLKYSFKVGKKISSILPKALSPLRSTMKKIYLEKKGKVKTKRKLEILEQINQKNISSYEKRILEHSINMELDVFDDKFRVPLLFAGYGVKSGSIIQQQVRTIDVFPTIFEIIKIPNDIEVDGESLLPLIKGLSLEESPAYMEGLANWTIERAAKIVGVVGIRYKNFKYFRARNNPNENIGLYDLKEDPHEENNLAREKPEKLIEMEKILSKIRADVQDELEKEPDELRDLEEEKLVEAELKKLGYLS